MGELFGRAGAFAVVTGQAQMSRAATPSGAKM